MIRRTLRSLALALALALTACASTSPKPAQDDVGRQVEARSGHRVRFRGDSDDDKKVERLIDDLLARELTADAAVRVALLSNPALQSKLEELAIGQADLVQAGLLKNPVLGFGATAWEQEHISPNLFATLEQDFLDLVTLPLRKRVAATQLEATKLEVADHVLEVAAETRAAFYRLQAAEQVVAMRRLVEKAAQASGELAQRQHEAGTMNDLALNTQLGLAAQARLDRRRAESEAAVLREELNTKLGLWGKRTGWRPAPRLPEMPRQEVDLEGLEETALTHRLDVDAARRNVQALGYALSLAKTTRWTGTVNVAVEAGRLRHSRRFSFGPSVALEIPLFDQRTAQIAKLEAFHRQSEADLRHLAIDVRADVRANRAKLVAARGIVDDYGAVVVPVRERIVKASQEQYDAMLLGVYQLIQAKQSEFDTYREYIEALRDYWIARSDLERAIGRRLEGRARPSGAASR